MSTFEWNKIVGSVLVAMIVAMVAGILSNAIVHPVRLEKVAYLPAGAEGEAGASSAAAGGAAAPAGPEPVAMDKADPKHGEQVAKACLQCHTFEKGGANKIGPNLFGVMAENIATKIGYQFSSALKADKDQKWDPEKLNVWLWKPQQFAKGTKMAFPGLPKAQDRADVIAYLESLK